MVERILSRHSQIEALGELPIIAHMAQRIQRESASGTLAQSIASLDEATCNQMGQWYLARARERMKSDALYFVDKMHMNWRYLPLILRILPQALVIDIRRGAMDCCWSNFKVLFAAAHPAANDLTDIARFYQDYTRQCDTLRKQVPNRIHFLKYEALVDDFDQQAQSLFEALDIPFEQEVVDFHLSDAPVATASSEQVRAPLNRKGIDAWKPYAKHLQPLRSALGELAEAAA